MAALLTLKRETPAGEEFCQVKRPAVRHSLQQHGEEEPENGQQEVEEGSKGCHLPKGILNITTAHLIILRSIRYT